MFQFIRNFSDPIHDNEEVLFDILPGKRYLDNLNQTMPQSGQKGGTCWYYSFNYLRPRYGKNFDSVHHPQRKVEKILSSHRKKITELDTAEQLFKLITNEFSNTKITVPRIKKFIEELKLKDQAPNKKASDLFDGFMNQNKFACFQEYFKDKNIKERIENSKKTLVRLGIEPNEALRNFLKDKAIEEVELITPEELEGSYFQIIKREAIKAYKLNYSSWNPLDGVNSLFTALRGNGPIWIAGLFGKPFYKKPTHLLEDRFAEKKIFGWKPSEYFCDDTPITHTVIIIGAQKIRGTESVFFIDPNDNNNENPIIYKMSYKRLCSSIKGIFNASYTSDGISLLKQVRGPFALHANQNDPDVNYAAHFLNYLNKTTIKEKIEAFPALVSAFENLPQEWLIKSQRDSFDQWVRFNLAYEKLLAHGIEGTVSIKNIDTVLEYLHTREEKAVPLYEDVLQDKLLWLAIVTCKKSLLRASLIQDLLSLKQFCDEKKNVNFSEKYNKSIDNFYKDAIRICLSEKTVKTQENELLQSAQEHFKSSDCSPKMIAEISKLISGLNVFRSLGCSDFNKTFISNWALPAREQVKEVNECKLRSH